MGNIVGIDLGTTNTVVAVLDDEGEPKIKHNFDGQNLTPSAVWIDEENGSTLIGVEAIKQGDIGFPIYQNYRRDIGENKVYEIVNGIEITPERLSTLVLKKVKDDLDSESSDEETTNCVITYPANFTNESREATVSAGKLAGWPIGFGINEPAAAALYFAYKHKVTPGKYAVYQFGRGTWDISVVEIKGQEVNVIDTEGIPICGGKDFDESLQTLIEEKYKEETGSDIEYTFNKKSIYEDVKKSLSALETRHVMIQQQSGNPTRLTVTRDEFTESTAGLLAQTEMVCESIFDRHKDIKDVFLVGGSTRVPAVKESLEKAFKKPGLIIGNPDEAVALGAAIYAGLQSDSKDLNSSQNELLDSIHPANEISEHSEPTQFDEWEIYYGALIKYKHIYKDVLIPYSFKTSDGISLGKWCADQREEYNSGNLSEFHIEQLNELGFDWVINLATTSRSNETSSQYLGIACFMTDKHTGRTELRHRWIIDKGTELPCTVSEYLYTHVDNQKVIPIQVLECPKPEDEMEYVKIIWEGELNLPPGVKAGDEIELIFEKMEDQRLNCKFVYMKTGTTEAVSLKGQREIMEQDKNTIEKFTLE